jgi:hypothetical protein
MILDILRNGGEGAIYSKKRKVNSIALVNQIRGLNYFGQKSTEQ